MTLRPAGTAADRPVALADGVLQGEVNKRQLRERIVKRHTDKVKWNFSSVNSLREGKVATWHQQKNLNCVEEISQPFCFSGTC